MASSGTDVICIRGARHVVTACISCGVDFTVPGVVWDAQVATGGYHYCPNGHSQGWSKEGSEIERIRRERDRLKQDVARIEEEAGERVRRAEAAQRRLEKRVNAGLCTCCNRTFTNLQRHMKTKHTNVVPLTARKA